VNENLRGQPHDLFIEDAIQETTVLTGAISAEYGRFTGGVVTAVSKSGGNEFSGTFRDSLNQAPKWTALSPSADGAGAPRGSSTSTRRTKQRSAAASSATVCGSSSPAATSSDHSEHPLQPCGQHERWLRATWPAASRSRGAQADRPDHPEALASRCRV
jgi:hypothetical protein